MPARRDQGGGLLNDLSPSSGFPDHVERFVSAGWGVIRPSKRPRRASADRTGPDFAFLWRHFHGLGGNLPRLCTSASPSRPLTPNPSTSPKAVSGQCTRSPQMRPISARFTVVARRVTQDHARPFCTMMTGTSRSFLRPGRPPPREPARWGLRGSLL